MKSSTSGLLFSVHALRAIRAGISHGGKVKAAHTIFRPPNICIHTNILIWRRFTMAESPPPSYADSISDTSSSLSSLSTVGEGDSGSPTYRNHTHRPSRSSSGDSGYFSAGDPPSPMRRNAPPAGAAGSLAMYCNHIHRPSRSSSGDSGYFSAGDPPSPVRHNAPPGGAAEYVAGGREGGARPAMESWSSDVRTTERLRDASRKRKEGRNHIHRPSRSSSGDSGYFSAEDPPSPVRRNAPPAGAAEYVAFRWLSGSPTEMESGYQGGAMPNVAGFRAAPVEDNTHISAARAHPKLNMLLDIYRMTRIDAEDSDLIESFTEIWLVANATRPKEDINVTWPGDIVETSVSEAWSFLVGNYAFLDDKRYGTKKWGDLQDMLMHLKLEVPYIHGVKHWMKRFLERNENTPDSDYLVFIPGHRSKYPASVAWKKWEKMAHTMGQHVKRAATWQFMRARFVFYKETCHVERENFGGLRLSMEHMLKRREMADFVDLRSEEVLSYET
ncbi:hypothetical protein BDZ89DRAFT_1116630 [Hymenopellis radicata]|nr:hypothetical protein BDZ89DRAFT_1116630 [Hymenopellis radicata]